MQIRRLLAAAALAVGSLTLVAGPAAAEEDHAEDVDVSGEDGTSAGEHAEVDLDAVAEEIHHAEENGQLELSAADCAIEAIENNDADNCHESPNPILPATNELLWGALSFAALLAALWKFGIPAVTSMSNERTQRISNDLHAAETARVEAETVLAEYQRQLAEARAESGRIIEEARQQAEQVRRDLVARAEAEAAEVRQRAAEQAEGERARVMGELRGEVAALAVDLAERVVQSSLDREASLRLIENYINEVGTRR